MTEQTSAFDLMPHILMFIHVLIGIGIGIGIYSYPQIMKNLLFSSANSLFDLYLYFKYWNYKPQLVTQSNYKVTKMLLASTNNSLNTIELPVNNKLILKSPNLSDGPQKINCNLINSLVGCHLYHQTLLYIYFVYNHNEYILPIEYDINKEIDLPIYALDDLDTCFQIEYERASTKYNADSLQVINKFAGPKGNFYNDTQYCIKPEYIICNQTHKCLLSNDKDDALQLVTNMGQQYKFTKEEFIKLPDF